MVKTENILISAAHLCYTNGNTPDFFMCSVLILGKKERTSLKLFLSVIHVCTSFAIHLCCTLCEGGFYFVYQVESSI